MYICVFEEKKREKQNEIRGRIKLALLCLLLTKTFGGICNYTKI